MKHFNKILSYDYWHSDNPDYAKSKWRLFGLLLAILISILALIIVKMTEKSVNNKINDKVLDITRKAAIEQQKTQYKLDSLTLQTIKTQYNIDTLKSEVKEHNNSVQLLQQQYQIEYNNLLKLKYNEKDYITPANPSEQLIYISKYKYAPIN